PWRSTFHHGLGVNCASGYVNRELWIVAFFMDEARIEHELRQRDDRVTTHGAVAFVVNKEDIKVGVEGRSDHCAIHIRMTTRFPHRALADMVIVLAKITTLL